MDVVFRGVLELDEMTERGMYRGFWLPPGEDGLGNSRKKEGKELESVSSKIVGKWRRRRFGGRGVRGEGGRSDKTRFPNFFGLHRKRFSSSPLHTTTAPCTSPLHNSAPCSHKSPYNACP